MTDITAIIIISTLFGISILGALVAYIMYILDQQ